MSTTAPARSTGARVSGGYVHDMMFATGPADLVSRTVAFVRDGLASGEPAMVVLPGPRAAAVRRRLGDEGREVRFVDMAALGANPARIIDAWSQFARECGAQPSRGVGEPLWTGRRAAEVAECQLHEALLNVAIGADRPLWLRCPYDATGLPQGVLERARRAHPFVASDDGAARPSGSYAGDGLGLEEFSRALPAPTAQPVVRRIGDGTTLGALRDLVTHAASVTGVDRDRATDLGLAVHELAVNTMTHGGGSGRLRLSREGGALVCEVWDRGVLSDPLAGRRRPGREEDDGRGLWMVNQLCDLVQLRSGEQGTQVRIHTWLWGRAERTTGRR